MEPLAEIDPDFETDDDAVKLLDPDWLLVAVNEAEGVTVKVGDAVNEDVTVTEAEAVAVTEMEAVPVGDA